MAPAGKPGRLEIEDRCGLGTQLVGHRDHPDQHADRAGDDVERGAREDHHLGLRRQEEQIRRFAAIEAKVMPLLREGRIKPLMDSTFPLEKAADAHRRMETSAHIGKIVLTV